MHTPDTSEIFDEDIGWAKPIDMARHWLARQMEECPVRLDRIRRTILFQEVEAAVTSVDHMNHHSQAVYDSNHWCSYDVFLKAALRYLSEQGKANDPIAAIVLLKMAQLYRRRPAKVYQRAAARKMKQLHEIIDAPGVASYRWLTGLATYEEAYMNFLMAPTAADTETVFQKSVELERRFGRPVGALVSLAQSQVVAVRRGNANRVDLDVYSRQLSYVRDKLAPIDGPLAALWANVNIPVFLGYINAAMGRNDTAIDVLTSLAFGIAA